jgi:hypothetical protein
VTSTLLRSAIVGSAALVAAACSQSPSSPSSSKVAPAEITMTRTKRAPDPALGTRLPLPDHFYVVAMVAAQHPEALARSCPEQGGSWEFLDRVLEALHAEDSRWGYNRKSAVPGGVSTDVVVYNYSAGPDEGTANAYEVDILSDQCGNDARPAWNVVTASGGQRPSWTSRGRW